MLYAENNYLSYSLIFCRYCFAAGGSFICGCFSLKIDIYILFWILDDYQKKMCIWIYRIVDEIQINSTQYNITSKRKKKQSSQKKQIVRIYTQTDKQTHTHIHTSTHKSMHIKLDVLN